MNKLNQFLAGLGVILLAILLEIFLKGMSDSLTSCGYATVIILEWVYICHLLDKDNKTREL